MSLDITFKRRKPIRCPHCGEVVGHTEVKEVDSGGRVWYPLLERLGYYVDYQRQPEDGYVDWYGKDMILTSEQLKDAYDTAKRINAYAEDEIVRMLACAIVDGDEVAVHASW